MKKSIITVMLSVAIINGTYLFLKHKQDKNKYCNIVQDTLDTLQKQNPSKIMRVMNCDCEIKIKISERSYYNANYKQPGRSLFENTIGMFIAYHPTAPLILMEDGDNFHNIPDIFTQGLYPDDDDDRIVTWDRPYKLPLVDSSGRIGTCTLFNPKSNIKRHSKKLINGKRVRVVVGDSYSEGQPIHVDLNYKL